MTSPGADWVEQARRVVEGFAEGLRHAADGGVPPGGPVADSPAGDAAAGHAGGSDCRWCPLCQAAAVLRGERPDLTAALADILTATAAALRQLGGVPEPGDAPAGAAPDADVAEAAQVDDDGGPPVVQRIELA